MKFYRLSHQVFLVFFIMVFLYFNYFSALLNVSSSFAVGVQFVSSIVVLLITFFNFNKQRVRGLLKYLLMCFLLFSLYSMVLLSNDFQYDSFKSLKFFFVFLFCGYVGFFLSTDFNSKILSYGFLITSLVFLLLYIFFGKASSSGTGRIVLGDANPIWNARLIGVSLIYSFLYLFLQGKNRFLCFLVILVSTYSIYLTGSRGPAVSAFIALFFVTLIFSLNKYRNVSYFLFFIFFSTLVYIYLFEYSGFFNFDSIGGTSGRDYLYSAAINMFLSEPLGIGMGGYERNIGFFSRARYPHNIFLESLVETGILFTFILFYFIFYSLKRGVNLTRFDYHGFVFLLAIFIYSLANSMFSGDLTSPKELYILMFLFIFKKNRDCNHV